MIEIAALRERALEALARPAARRWLSAASAVLLAQGAARWTWTVLAPESEPLLKEYDSEGGGAPEVRLDELIAAAPFGRVGGAKPEEAPVSALNLALTGVFEGGPDSVAMISVDGKPQEAFRVGQAVKGDAVLQAVYPDRVLIRRGASVESVLLPKPASAAIVEPAPASPDPPLAAASKAEELLRGVRWTPAPGGGLVVDDVAKDSALYAGGLRPGERVRSVNGHPIGPADSLPSMTRALQGASELRIEVERDGQKQELHYRLE